MSTMNTQIMSVGFMACRLQLSVAELQEALAVLKIGPEVTINDIPHYATYALHHVKRLLADVAEPGERIR